MVVHCILRVAVLSVCLELVGGVCLPNAILPEDKRYVTAGVTDPVRFVTSERTSAHILTAVAQILVEEVLGYHIQVESKSMPWISLAGCISTTGGLECGQAKHHVLVDTVPYHAELPAGIEAPQDLGSLGFSHQEHVWVKGSIHSAALDQGVFLDHFRTYNSSAAAANYFHPLSVFNTSDLTRCDEPLEKNVEYDEGMKLYLEKTSDAAGTVGAGLLRRKCQDDYWWLSPGCRTSNSDCIPLLLRDLQAIPAVMLFATAYSIPLAVARADSLETFVRLVKETDALFYWWAPDSTFTDLEPQQVFLPRDFGDGQKRAGKAVSSDLKAQAQLIWELISKMSLLQDEVLELLQAKVNTSVPSPLDVACGWLRSNDRWREWLQPPECGGSGYWHSSGQCRQCQRGSRCQGEPKVLPGFYATIDHPNEVFQCFGFDASRCPGGPAGSCAAGRDPTSLTCSACLRGYRTSGAECVQCGGAWPYFNFILMIILRVLAIGSLYFLLTMASSQRPTSTSLLHAEIGTCELLTFLQIVALIHQFNLAWSEPIMFLWQVLDVFKFDAVIYASVAQCFFSMKENVGRYAAETMLVPLLFLTVPALFHLVFNRCLESMDGQPLRRTIGTLFVVYFISMCGTLTVPFRCQTHPNQLQTLQVFPEIFCNFQGEHLELVAIFAAGSIIPITFLTYCFWIMCQYPERLHNGDSKFVRSCAFLTLRLRPGEGLFSLFLLCRNMLLVFCPLFSPTSSGLATMSLLLMASLVVTVSRQPWRAKGSNLIDILMHVCLLFILDLIEVHQKEVDARAGSPDGGNILVVTLAVLLVLLAFLVTIVYGLLSYVRIRCRKPFRFFICHHKAGAGALARLIKMELQRRIPLVHVFVDSDQLSDLTEPLCYVGYEVETLILLGTPKVLLQKWCVAEIVIARLQNIPSVLVQLPDFCMPDASFITNYMIHAPQMHDLASYGIEVREIRATILWVCKLEVLRLPDLQPRSVNSVIDSLTKSHGPALNMNNEHPKCAVLADPDNLMATATAYVLWGLLDHEFFMQGMGSCIVPHQSQDLPKDMTSLLFICSEGCFNTQQVLDWLLQACGMPGCFVLPVLIGDHFQFPSADFYQEIFADQSLDDAEYNQAFIEAVFLEAAGKFTPAISPGAELAHQTSELLQRIKLRTRTDSVKPRPLGRSHSFAAGDRLKIYLRKQSTMINRIASMLFTTPNNNNNNSKSEGVSSRSSYSTSSWAVSDQGDARCVEVDEAEAEDMCEQIF